jgi:biopolymer transport protein ExbD
MPKLEPIPSGQSRGSSRRSRGSRVSTSLAEINVVPLVDVMLVLLVIFMVAAPMMTQGFKVELPQSRQSPAIDQDPVTVSVPTSFAKDNRVRFGDESIPLAVLAERVNQVIGHRDRKSVILAGDGAIAFQHVMTVMDVLKDAGINSVSIQTQPVRRRAP